MLYLYLFEAVVILFPLVLACGLGIVLPNKQRLHISWKEKLFFLSVGVAGSIIMFLIIVTAP